MNKKNLLGITLDGNKVFVDMEKSHAVTHFQDTPRLFDAIKKVIPTLELNDDLVRIEVNTGKEVGSCSLVETNESDETVYALRPRRTQYSRFVKGKQATPSSWIVVDLRKTGEKKYNLYTAFVGRGKSGNYSRVGNYRMPVVRRDLLLSDE